MIYVSTGLISLSVRNIFRLHWRTKLPTSREAESPSSSFAYLLRVLLFFNPVAMIEFRRLAHEEEKVCDDIAIELTGKT